MRDLNLWVFAVVVLTRLCLAVKINTVQSRWMKQGDEGGGNQAVMNLIPLPPYKFGMIFVK